MTEPELQQIEKSHKRYSSSLYALNSKWDCIDSIPSLVAEVRRLSRIAEDYESANEQIRAILIATPVVQ